MTLKKLFVLGGALAGAALLQDKGRRERVFGQARGIFDQLKARASELASTANQPQVASRDTGMTPNGRSTYSTY